MTRGKFLAVVCMLGLMVIGPTQAQQQMGRGSAGALQQ